MIKPSTISDVQDIVRSQPCIGVQGGGSKTALRTQAGNVTWIDMSNLAGIVEYQPEEFTFTAYAGSRLTDVERALAAFGQYLPFDPPLAEQGATLGGTVAAGLSGPERYRHGGIRDFLLGVQFVDGQGNLVRSGGRVVKNSAGFDLAKFMVGSLGQYGLLVELSFKVFPRPAAYITLQAHYPSLPQALEALIRLTATPLELFTLDLIPEEKGASLLIRLGGMPQSLQPRLQRLQRYLDEFPAKPQALTLHQEEAEVELWRAARHFTWLPPEHILVKIPLTPRRVPGLDQELQAQGAVRRYSVGANLAWVAWSAPVERLDEILRRLELSGLVILGQTNRCILGIRSGEAFARRVRQALDPLGKFASLM